ncbi:hypothetical protein M9H77_15839 [Catharanthus roseus]|uniref:Uncharacterized protein n=1 Tax=Catharanthus roseus TaxID=4058 RepID=A0ACC0B148_CATRO|nr:hypothetical protein M9H77_15839 [Catharanthus roseus]
MEAAEFEVIMEEEAEGCSTPKREEYKIPMMSAPPPPPRKKRCDWGGGGMKKETPKNGYFNPPDDLELLFTMPPRRQACA